MTGDGGGNAPALARSLHGSNRVARTLLAWARSSLREGTIHQVEVNGQPGALLHDADGRLVSVMALDITNGQIQGVNAIVNPDKLRHLGELGDMRALLKRREI